MTKNQFVPSKQQKYFFDFVVNDNRNAVISAVAGSGKTTTLLKSIELIPLDKSILFIAFNKSIANELMVRVPKTNNIEVKTVHGYGYGLLKNSFNCNIDNFKYHKILNNIKSDNTTYGKKIKNIFQNYDDTINIKDIKKNVLELSNLGRLFNIDIDNEKSSILKLNELSKRYNINNLNNESTIAYNLIKIGILDTNSIDFTDMIYLPLILNLIDEKYDYIYIDECQDISTIQRMLLLNSIKDNGGRFFAVGDEKQSIYSFVGADSESFKILTETPNTIKIPLSVTYRCEPKIVSMVKHINPDIVSYKNEDEGIIYDEFSYKNLESNDMVLCRETFPLVSLCISLLNLNKKSTIIGSDIGKILIKMILDSKDFYEEFNMINVFSYLYKQKNDLIDSIMNKNNILREDAITDNLVIMLDEKIKIIEGLVDYNTTPEEVIEKINNIFKDDSKEGIILSTIHKSKGLESERVFILHKELMPSKYAKESWELEQEQNLIYVAYTRAKKVLGFIHDYDAWRHHDTKENLIEHIKDSEFVGTINSKIFLNLKIKNIKNFKGPYGDNVVYDLIDDKNNNFSKFGEILNKFTKDKKEPIVGSELSCYGLIKEHKIFNGKKTTILSKLFLY